MFLEYKHIQYMQKLFFFFQIKPMELKEVCGLFYFVVLGICVVNFIHVIVTIQLKVLVKVNLPCLVI